MTSTNKSSQIVTEGVDRMLARQGRTREEAAIVEVPAAPENLPRPKGVQLGDWLAELRVTVPRLHAALAAFAPVEVRDAAEQPLSMLAELVSMIDAGEL